MPRVAIVSLGCPKNSVDSEGLAGLLASGGHELVDAPDGADIALVNTCGFIEAARRETVEEILELGELKERGRLGGVVLSGCLVARAAGELADSLPEVDALVDFAAYPRIASIVEEVAAGTISERVQGTPGTRFDPAWWDASMAAAPRLAIGRPPWSYLKIAEGCDRGCAFCAIPLMRGRLRSRGAETIEKEARRLVELGVSELSLVSQDSVMWGRDTGEGDISDLLRRLERVDGLRRIRLMYLHPRGLADELIDLVASSDVVASYLDLSLQHVAPGVLRAMGRWGGRERFARIVERIRARDPGAGVRATFILGFPGETDRDAAEVERFVAETELDWVGVFTYSREEGTRAATLPHQVPAPVARERAERVTRVAEETMEARARSLVGSRLDVLAERLDLAEGEWIGRSPREAPEIDGEVRFGPRHGIRVGNYVDVLATGVQGADLVGRVAGGAPVGGAA